MTPRSRLLSCIAVILLIQITSPAPSSGQTTGSISGIVTDEQGGALPAAVVVAVHDATGSRRETTTQRDGRYVLTDLQGGGPYSIVVTLAGFRREERRDVLVSAGAQRSVDFRMPLATLSEEVTVTAGSEIARLQKQAADHIVDVVSADSLGRFPDNNAAEALRRIPGVSMEIDQGEGRFVVVRGIDASLNNVTINGQIVGTPAEFGTRGVSMDSVPADLISRLEVTKAVRPDMDANAIGASINISTLSAFDRAGGFVLGSLRSGYNEMGGRAPYSGSLSFGRVLDARRRWGVVIGGSYSYRRYDSELYRIADGSWTSQNGFFVPQNNAFFLYDVERQRQGINASLEFRPAAQQSMFLRLNHNLFTDQEGRQQTQFDFTRGTLTNQTPTSGRFSQGRATREYRDYTQKHLINALMLGGNHDLHGSAFDWKVGGSRGQRRTPNRVDWEFRSAANAFPSTYDVSNPRLPIITPSDNFYSADAYPFRRVRFRNDLEREDVWTGEANLRRAFRMNDRSAYWKTGVKVITRDKYQNRENRNYLGSTFTLADFGLGATGPNDFFEDNFRFGPTLNLDALKAFVDSNPGRFVADTVTTQQNSLEQDFDAGEDVYAGYLMAGIDFSTWNLLAGARVENTQGAYSAHELLFAGGAFTGRTNPARGTTGYTDVLPGVHINILPKQNVTLRFAWTNTIGRPSYAQLAPIRVLDDIQNEDGTFTGSLSSGNPDLEPYRSMNVDASFEYYLKNGLISVAPFYKRIRNPIYSRSFVESGTVLNGRTYDRFGFTRPENADRGRITGVELSLQTSLPMLPSPFDGLGLNFNYTFVDSSVTVFGREEDDLPFFGQSDRVGNVAVLYQKYGIEAQVSASYTSATLGSLGLNLDSDNYADSYLPIDAKASYAISPHFKPFIEVRNLNNEPRLRYAGSTERRVAHEIYSWTLYAGIDWSR